LAHGRRPHERGKEGEETASSVADIGRGGAEVYMHAFREAVTLIVNFIEI
jgi:hypothetical protein